MRPFRHRSDRPMNCMQVGRRLQRYLDGDLDDLAARRIMRHLEDCRRCGMEATAYTEIKASLARRAIDVPDERERRGEPAVRRRVTRLHADGLAEQGDAAIAIAGLGERGAAVAQDRERRGAVFELQEHLRETTVPPGESGELLDEVAELLLGLTQPAGLEALQPRGERDLVVEVLRGPHGPLVCAPASAS